ncbi:MAG: hypothetical protein H7Z21_19885 [Hymenobacter sp.]|nr:hypothetical protein [Hymenobacter sp.]
MRKSYTTALILLLALGSFAAQAQMSDRYSERATPTAGQLAAADAVAITRDMTNRLHLNEGQFLKLLPLNRTRLARLRSIELECGTDEAAREAKAAELEAQYEQECSRILTPSQLSQLQLEKNPPAPAPTNGGNGVG